MTAGSDADGTRRAAPGHPDLETLADLQEGLLAQDEDRLVRRHVEACAECRDALAALDATQDLLGSLPPVAMPEEVAARIDTALADAAAPSATGAPNVVPAPGRTRWWRGSAFATSAAAAVVVLLVVGVVASALRASHNGSQTDTPTAGGALASPTAGSKTFTATVSGRNYTATNLADAIPSLLGGRSSSAGSDANAAAGPVGSAADTATSSGASPSAEVFSGRKAAPAPTGTLESLSHPQQLLGCVAALTERPAGSVTPLAVDLGTFQGKPAMVIVLPTPNRPTLVDVWVVGRGCSSSDQQFIYFLRTARPA